MKREIKFRGISINGDMVYGTYHYSNDNELHYIFKRERLLERFDQNEWSLHEREVTQIRENTVGQFTGLKDKNGKEIYEGDIVKWDDKSKGKYWRVCQIKWVKSHYELIGYAFDSKTPDDKHKVNFSFGAFIYEHDGALEIIGNVFQNPELLK